MYMVTINDKNNIEEYNKLINSKDDYIEIYIILEDEF